MPSPHLPLPHNSPSRRRVSSYLFILPLGFLLILVLTLLHLFPIRELNTHPGRLPPSSHGPQKPLPLPEFTTAFKIGTFNLRYDGNWRETVPVGKPGDGREEKGGGGEGERGRSSLALTSFVPVRADREPFRLVCHQPWAERRWRIRDMLHFLDYEILGFQECLHNQLLDLQSLLGPSWSSVGVGRDDGKEAGEFSPIFFSSSRFEALSVEYIWLSETPEVVGSRGWDASAPRIATILTLLDRSSSALIHVSATHWDDSGLTARHESGKLLRRTLPAVARRVEKKLGKGDGNKLEGVVLLMGDLNSPSHEPGFQALTSPSSILSTPPFHFFPTLLPPPAGSSAAFGPKTTYTGFEGWPSDAPTEIDFIFLYDESVKKGRWGVRKYGVVEGGYDEREQEEEGAGDRWRGKLSDHRFVGGEVVRWGR